MSAPLERKAVEAETHVANDLGEFSAFAATYDIDRVHDRIRFGAFENTIARWQASGNRIPVHWEHRGEAKNVIGSVDPATMREVAGLGLYVEGKLDLDDSDVAREAWRSMKDNRVALSFGYMTVKSQRRDGLNELLELDLFEISVAPGPINPETRFLSLKATAERTIPTDAELRGQAKALGIELPLSRHELRRHCDKVALEAAHGFEPLPKRDPEPAKAGSTLRELRKHSQQVQLDAALGWEALPQPSKPEAKGPTDAELRAKAAELGVPLPPPPRPDEDSIRARARNQMLALLTLSDEQLAAYEGEWEGLGL